MSLPILFEDQDLIVINKPHGLLVHRTKMDFFETESVVDLMREQLKSQIFTIHRLDKPTSGVLVMAKNQEMARLMSEEFAGRNVHKKYIAFVRGVLKEDTSIDHPLKEELDDISDKKANRNKPPQDALTRVKLLGKVELPVQVDKYPTSRYSLVEATPITGRKHQIRRHLRHINHPIIGDITHGSGKHNRFFENEYKIRKLLLTCTEISFKHPKTMTQLTIEAPLSSEFSDLLKKLDIQKI